MSTVSDGVSDSAAFETVKVEADGWSEWQSPIMDDYRMKCCDCGLVHKVEFRVVKIIARGDDGTWDADLEANPDYRVQMRMRR